MKMHMMNNILFLILFLFGFGLNAQNNLEYEFDKARAMLATRNIEEALISLKKIYREDPKNGNINFLLGAAYAELPNKSDISIFHLKKALPFVSENYAVGNYAEKASPIHTYYYLTLSLVQQDKCAEASLALEELLKYSGKLEPYFIEEAEKNMIKCPFEKSELEGLKLLDNPNPEGYNPEKIEEEELDSAALAERGMLIKSFNYSTKVPLYGVQIGSNINPSPTSSYSNVKNVDVFVDNKGIIRYVVGHFPYRSQAESLLESIKEKGYSDAFIVNVNDERKYPNELISYNNVNVRAGVKGKVDYYIQLGAFENSIPDSILSLYYTVDRLIEMKYEKYTLLLKGPVDFYKEAVLEQEVLSNKLGVKSFIVAFNNRKKIALQEAINHTDTENE